MIQDDNRSVCIEVLLPDSLHNILSQVAALQGLSVSDFVAQSSKEAAEQFISEHEQITLSVADQERFVG